MTDRLTQTIPNLQALSPARANLPVQETNIVGIIRNNLPVERREVITKIEETRVYLQELTDYLHLLNSIGREAGVPDHDAESPTGPGSIGELRSSNDPRL